MKIDTRHGTIGPGLVVQHGWKRMKFFGCPNPDYLEVHTMRWWPVFGWVSVTKWSGPSMTVASIRENVRDGYFKIIETASEAA